MLQWPYHSEITLNVIQRWSRSIPIGVGSENSGIQRLSDWWRYQEKTIQLIVWPRYWIHEWSYIHQVAVILEEDQDLIVVDHGLRGHGEIQDDIQGKYKIYIKNCESQDILCWRIVPKDMRSMKNPYGLWVWRIMSRLRNNLYPLDCDWFEWHKGFCGSLGDRCFND